ncbi:MAG: HupE/UreJ family protein [Kofleriaceae bacterium]|nr:HupE/UreJ family protein [Kofleriaceae bacterium]
MKRLIVIALLAMGGTAYAHKPSDAHLHLTIHDHEVNGELDIAVRDLDGALGGFDRDGNRDVTWAELEAGAPLIARYVSERLELRSHGPCPFTPHLAGIVELVDGPYVVVAFEATCSTRVHALQIAYRLLFDFDAQHRGLVHVSGAAEHVTIIRDATPIELRGSDLSMRAFIVDGILHIWHGLDHLLFLACLLLPAVSRGQRTLRGVAVEVLEIVTAFTLAHSITLIISAVGFVRFPARYIETAIALTVVAAALNNLLRAVDARWLVAFTLGLVHGFGFSSVLVDLGLPSHELVGALLGFNIGVELGQATFVILLLPVLFALRRTLAYRVLLWGGSAAIAVLALFWAYQRWSL